MKDFYVTFGNHLIRYHLHVRANNEDIVRAYMRHRSGLNCWCRVLQEEPMDTARLEHNAVELFYSAAEHIT